MFLYLANSRAQADVFIILSFSSFLVTSFLFLKTAGFFTRANFVKKSIPDPHKNEVSKRCMGKYRKRWSLLKDTGAVLYTKESLQNYLNNKFDKITAKMAGETVGTLRHPNAGYKYQWVVGFYPMFKKCKTNSTKRCRTRLDFLIAPTMAAVKCAGKKGETIQHNTIYSFYDALLLSDEKKKLSPYKKAITVPPPIPPDIVCRSSDSEEYKCTSDQDELRLLDDQILAEEVGYDTGHMHP